MPGKSMPLRHSQGTFGAHRACNPYLPLHARACGDYPNWVPYLPQAPSAKTWELAVIDQLELWGIAAYLSTCKAGEKEDLRR
jgi:hypothetical protein